MRSLLPSASLLAAGLLYLPLPGKASDFTVDVGSEAELTALASRLRDEIVREGPAIEIGTRRTYQARRESVIRALEALAEARANIGTINKAEGLVGHARHTWLAKAAKGLAKAKADLREAKTPEAKQVALKSMREWQENKQAGLDALKKRQLDLIEAKKNEAEFRQQLEAAELAVEKARLEMAEMMAGLDLDAVLGRDRLDGALAKHAMLHHAKPKRLAGFAAASAANRKLVEELLSDDGLIIEMMVADGASDGQYGPAMRILQAIQTASPRASKGRFARLALGTALEHAEPVKQRNLKGVEGAPEMVDPVQRYKFFEESFLAGDLDPGFASLSTWECRFVVNGDEPNEILEWGRKMLRNYRPDHILTETERWRYVQLVRTEIPWTTKDYEYDRDDLHLVQNILMNGGTCGRRAIMGRFLLRAFGVPTIPRPQKGHASLARWTADGWEICLGGGWGLGWTKTPYKKDLNFLASSEARALGETYLKVKRAHWIGLAMGEPQVWGLTEGNPEFWNGVALYAQQAMLAKNDDNEPPEEESSVAIPAIYAYELTAEDRKVTVDGEGVITLPAAATSQPTQTDDRIIFMESLLGGAQLHYAQSGPPQAFEYQLQVPKAGKYSLTVKVVTPSWRQGLMLTVNGGSEVRIPLPHTVGEWETTEPVVVDLEAGANQLTFSHFTEGADKGFSIKEFNLTPIKSTDK